MAAADAASHSLVARRLELERREDERQVLAESARSGERAVSVLRIVTWVILGVAFSATEGTSEHAKEPPEPLHMSMIGGWVLFAVALLIILPRVRFTPRRAFWWPLVFMLVDFGVITTLELTSHDAPQPAIAVATLAILLTFSIPRFSGIHVWTGAALATAAFIAEGQVQGWYRWPVALVVGCCFACTAVGVWWANRRVRRMFVDVRRRENLARFLPRQVAARVLQSGGRALEPVQREVTILFSDIRDFTTMSQRMNPGEVLRVLDDYFARMTEIVKAHDGMVNKFIGDGMLAVWGVPDELPDHATRAVKAALDMRRVMAELHATAANLGGPELRIGIGIHTGVVAAGMLGGADQHEYTVIGDAVNLASRIEGLTKKFETDLLVSDAAWKKVGAAAPSAWKATFAGDEMVKGRDEAVGVYRIDDQPA